MMYSVILADPPWQYSDRKAKSGSSMGSPDYYYPTLSLRELQQLPVSNIANPDCVLFCWATMPLITDGTVQSVVQSWGFTPKTLAFVWIKLNPVAGTIFKGLGHYTQGNAEVVMLATRGRIKRESKAISQIVMAPRGAHSEKPEEVHRRIERLYGDVPRIELFARREVPGWKCTGLDLDGVDIRELLK